MSPDRSPDAKVILALSIPLSLLVAVVSSIGLFTPGFYAAETANWQVQSIGQDTVDLLLLSPCLIITSIFAGKGSKAASLLWAGVVLYLAYTFAIYCFDVHFNKLFILYCLCFGLSLYSLAYFLLRQYDKPTGPRFGKLTINNVIAVYFIVVSVLFYALWLSEIIPAITSGTVPKSVTEAGLFTNAVHVIDLSLILPAIFLTGVLLLKKHSFGSILAPVMLTFFILMDITIGFLAVELKMKGMATDLTVALIMGLLTVISLVLLIWFLRTD